MWTALIVMVLAFAVQSTPSAADVNGWCIPRRWLHGLRNR